MTPTIEELVEKLMEADTLDSIEKLREELKEDKDNGFLSEEKYQVCLRRLDIIKERITQKNS